MTDAQLLLQYRDKNSQEAFSELLQRHTGWVYAVARRRVRDEHLAHDVTQAVFILLATDAKKIQNLDRLGAWLLQTTVYAANHAVREESRRRRREGVVASGRPEMDSSTTSIEVIEELSQVEAAVEKLPEADRAIISIRFYQGRSLIQVGTELGISADAARKRVDRALSRLRSHLQPGASTSLASMLASLTAIHNLPKSTVLPGLSGLNHPIPRAASISKGVSHMLFRNKIRKVAASVVVAMMLGGVLVCVHAEQSESAQPRVVQSDGPVRDRWLSTSDMTVIISRDRKQVTGYSKISGQWSQLTGENFKIDRFIAADLVAAYRDGNDLIAFSAVTNTWGRITLPAGSDTSVMDNPVIGNNCAAYGIAGTLYAFSATTGTWAELVVPRGEPAVPIIDANAVTVNAGGKMYIFGLKTGKWSDGF